jgi:hypothetical protein
LPYLLKEKIGARPVPSPSASYGAGKIKKSKGNFSARLRALARAAGLRFSSGGSAFPLKLPNFCSSAGRREFFATVFTFVNNSYPKYLDTFS